MKITAAELLAEVRELIRERVLAVPVDDLAAIICERYPEFDMESARAVLRLVVEPPDTPEGHMRHAEALEARARAMEN